MKTIQGKEFDFSDVILYNHNDKEIIMIVNDQEYLEKFKYSCNPQDAPIILMPYEEEFEKELIKKMKKIKSYTLAQDGVEVVYEDDTEVVFDLSNEGVVRNNLNSQKELAKKEFITKVSNISEEEKENRKKDINVKLRKGIISILANLTLILEDCAPKYRKNKKQKQEENIFINRRHTDYSNNLYQETVDKNVLLLKYQETLGINWNEDLALELVELMNGSYPNAIQSMNYDNASKEIYKVLSSFILLVTGNLSPEVETKDMIKLANFVDNQKDRVLLYNSMILAKNVVNELLGKYEDIDTLDETNYTTSDKFSLDYNGAIDLMLNYEFKTINDSRFLEMNKNSRWLILLIFEQINNLIPEESSIDIKVAGTIQKMYYKYFVNTENNKKYIPVLNMSGIEYNEKNSNETYSKEKMLSLAGLNFEDEETESDPNIIEKGICVETDDKFNSVTEEIYNIE